MSEALQATSPMDVGRIEKLVITLGQRTNTQNELLQIIAESLQGIDASLRQMALASNPAPNYQRSLNEYRSFDWGSIGAAVLKEDKDGVSVVEWNNQVFTRRSPNNKFDAAVWFSRCVGKDAENNNRYVRLITFKAASDAEPISSKAKKAVRV